MPRKLIYLVCAVGCAIAAAPAGANNVPTTGTRILLGLPCSVTPCVSTFPANEPFFIASGFVNEPRDVLVDPRTRFDLFVDGEAVQSTVDLDLNAAEPSKFNLSNFRFGLTGVHVFVGCWYYEGLFVTCAQRTVTFT
jgi:hypothetical protein